MFLLFVPQRSTIEIGFHTSCFFIRLCFSYVFFSIPLLFHVFFSIRLLLHTSSVFRTSLFSYVFVGFLRLALFMSLFVQLM